MSTAAAPAAMTVAQVMSSPVISVTAATGYQEVVRLLAANRISAVAVVDDGGDPVGLVSEEDLLAKVEGPRRRRLLERRGRRLDRARAGGQVAADVMSAPFPTIRQDVRLATAARRMHRLRIKHLGVVDEAGRLVGMLSGTDLLKGFLRPDAELRAEIEEDLLEGWLSLEGAQVEVGVDQGVVSLAGRVQLRSQAALLRHLVEQVDGVVAVSGQPAFDTDDLSRADAMDW